MREIQARRIHLRWQTRVSYWLSSAGYSLLFRIQNASHADALKAATLNPPIFVLGFWRSGTTLLHELFCCDPRFGFPSTYACLNPSHFLLTETRVRKHGAARKARRPMDHMVYSWISPQEDEFALLALGAPSPYEALIVPSLMRDPRRLLDLRRRSCDEQRRWREALQYFLRLLTVQQGKRIVLKSPPHGFKLPLLPSLFPGACYVVIERNPYEVFASNLKLWRTLVDLYALETPSDDEIEAFALAAYILHEEAISEGTRNIDPRLLAHVRYEDLVADPIGQMERLYRELGIVNFEAARPGLEQHLIAIADHKRNHLLLSREQKARVEAQWGTLISERGYGWPEDHVSYAAPGPPS